MFAINFILATLAFLSLGILVWQFVVSMRFPLHRRVAASDDDDAPPVTVLKPLRGADAETWHCLESWMKQDYRGPVQVRFGVASADDPASEMARQLIAAHPERDAQLVICAASLGLNAKVSTLIQLFHHPVEEPSPGLSREEGNARFGAVERPASFAEVGRVFARSFKPTAARTGLNRDPVIIISDADVHVPPDLLTNLVAPLRDEHVGLVNCFYRLANPATLAMQWEAVAINADFWSQVLQAHSLKPLHFALGAVMATTRRRLESIGGFEAVVDFLADDYHLGNLIARQGGRIVLSPLVVDCRESPGTWLEILRHQLRWARTIRVSQPLPYFLSILGNATLWPLLWLISSFATTARASFSTAIRGTTTIAFVEISPLSMALWLVPTIWLARMITAMCQASRLNRSHAHWAFFWMVPVKDLLAVVLWGMSFLGNSVEWRGRRYRVDRGGKLTQAL